MQIEIASVLKQAFPGSSIDQDSIAACDTVQGLEQDIASKTNTGKPLTNEKPVTNGHGTSTPNREHRSIMNGLPNGSSNAPGSPGYNTPYARSRSSTLGNNISNGTLHQTPSPCKASLFHRTSNEEATPFFCFHDGSGQGNVYARVADIDRTLYAFSDPDFASNHPRPRSLIEMAGRYAATISRAETPNVILGGTS